MSSKHSVKVGMRVRFAEDGVEGRIVWANATTVKIKWDDGEVVNWKRDKLAEKGVEILEEETPEVERPTTEQTAEAPQTEPTVEEQPQVEPATEASLVVQPETPVEPEQVVAESQPEEATPTPSLESQLEGSPQAQTNEASWGSIPDHGNRDGSAKSGTKHKSATAKKAKKEAKTKKLSALDAAAKLLQELGQPMNCKNLIEEMAKRGLWSSPNGATPEATLYAAILREMKAKGDKARFKKADRGLFAFNATA